MQARVEYEKIKKIYNRFGVRAYDMIKTLIFFSFKFSLRQRLLLFIILFNYCKELSGCLGSFDGFRPSLAEDQRTRNDVKGSLFIQSTDSKCSAREQQRKHKNFAIDKAYCIYLSSFSVRSSIAQTYLDGFKARRQETCS